MTREDDSCAASDRRWKLDRAALAALLAALHPDPDAAAREYERLRRRLVRYFSIHGIERAAEAADEALNRLAKRLSEGTRVEKIEPYLAGIARLLTLEERQRRQREHEVLLHLARAEASPGQEERVLQVLEQCLEELPPEAGELLRRYYAGEGAARIRAREELARELALSPNTLRNRILRLRERLERAVRERLEREDRRDVPPSGDSSTEEGD